MLADSKIVVVVGILVLRQRRWRLGYCMITQTRLGALRPQPLAPYPPIDCALCHHRIQGDIPGPRFNRVNTLAFVCKPNEQRPVPVPPPTQEGEAAVVVAFSHADSIAAGVETHEWQQHQMQGSCRAELTTATRRLGNAEAVAAHGVGGAVANKPEPSAEIPGQHWQIPAPAPRRQPM